MKKLFLSAMLFLSMGLMAQTSPVITFMETEHDFGQINEADGKVSHVFVFKNEGMEPLVLQNVRASCGCTTPKWTNTPVEPGETGEITVTYNPNGRPGKFSKTITITSNATVAQTKVYIRGEVIPKTAKPVENYPVKMGALSLKQKHINFGKVQKGQFAEQKIEYKNNSQAEVTVDLLTNSRYDAFLVPSLSFTTLKPNEVGFLTIRFESANTNDWAEQEYELYFVVNGKQERTDEFKVIVKANIVEDFSGLSPDQLQKAPIAELAKTVDMGQIKKGQTASKELTIKNVGVSPLLIRRVVNKHTDIIGATVNKTTLKSGKKGSLKISATATENIKPGKFVRTIELITNDPQNSIVKVVVSGEVVE